VGVSRGTRICHRPKHLGGWRMGPCDLFECRTSPSRAGEPTITDWKSHLRVRHSRQNSSVRRDDLPDLIAGRGQQGGQTTQTIRAFAAAAVELDSVACGVALTERDGAVLRYATALPGSRLDLP